jgi:hypothetical protein
MAKAVEAVLEPTGEIRLLEPLTVSKPTRVMVMVVPEQSVAEAYRDAKAETDGPEATARRAAAVAEFRAGQALPTAEAIKLFESLVAGTAKK